MHDGAAAGTLELTHSAAILARTNFTELTIGLYGEAAALGPNDLEPAYRVGHLLQHTAQPDGDDLARYREAAGRSSETRYVRGAAGRPTPTGQGTRSGRLLTAVA